MCWRGLLPPDPCRHGRRRSENQFQSARRGYSRPATPLLLMWNRNKRALALNLATDEGKEIAHALCEQADVVIDNFSAGVLDRWGVGYQAIHAVNKRAIYVQMSGMGDGGPWSKFVTYAPTIHALAGLTHTTGVTGVRISVLVFRTTIIKQACMGRSLYWQP